MTRFIHLKLVLRRYQVKSCLSVRFARSELPLMVGGLTQQADRDLFRDYAKDIAPLNLSIIVNWSICCVRMEPEAGEVQSRLLARLSVWGLQRFLHPRRPQGADHGRTSVRSDEAADNVSAGSTDR